MVHSVITVDLAVLVWFLVTVIQVATLLIHEAIFIILIGLAGLEPTILQLCFTSL